MDFMTWTEHYGVGDPLMDAYHHVFFQMVEEFRASVEERMPEAMKARLAFLVDYTIMHFESEERLMEASGYPELEAHRRTHEAFKAEILAIQKDYERDPSATNAERTLMLAQQWLISHIQGSDRAYARGRLRPAGA